LAKKSLPTQKKNPAMYDGSWKEPNPKFPFTPFMKKYIQGLTGLKMGESGKGDKLRVEE